MAEISRRDFLIKGGAGAMAVGAFASIPSLAREGAPNKSMAATHSAEGPATTTLGTTKSGPSLVAYIPDPRSGEIHYMIGTREVIHKDSALVARMLRDAN
jgi:hypothetical protein